MTNLKFIIALLICNLPCFGQDKTTVETANVLSYLINEKGKGFLSSRFDTFALKGINQRLKVDYFIRRITTNGSLHIDTLILSASEREYVDSLLLSLVSYQWTSNNIKENGLSEFSIVDSTKLKQNSEFDHIVYQIMKPIFIRDETVCFVYYDYACGASCGHGELSIFIKENGKWKNWWTLFQFDS